MLAFVGVYWNVLYGFNWDEYSFVPNEVVSDVRWRRMRLGYIEYWYLMLIQYFFARQWSNFAHSCRH